MDRPLEILIVDDSRDDARLVERMLVAGFGAVRCRHVESADGLADALATGRWDAVLCDHAVPGCSSAETLQAVRRTRPGVPFLVVSGQTDPAGAAALLRAGASDFVSKSRLPALVPALRRALGQRAPPAPRATTVALARRSADLQRLVAAMRAGHAVVGRILAAPDMDTAIWRAGRGLAALPHLAWREVRAWRLRGLHLVRWERDGDGATAVPSEGEHPVARVARAQAAWIDGPDTLVVPLRGRAGSYGALELDWARDGRRQAASEERLRAGLREVAGAVADALALTLEIHELLAVARVEARRDALTELPNRRALRSALVREFARARRSQGRLSVLALDADGFKPVNDAWGHAVGDLTLHALARLLLNAFRIVDVVARQGGDEFTVVMPGVSGDAAREVAGRVRRRVERFRFPNPEAPARPVHLTLSIGVASLRPTDADAAVLLARADAACYAAKLAGRNRVVADT